jgi:hypothetical protein
MKTMLSSSRERRQAKELWMAHKVLLLIAAVCGIIIGIWVTARTVDFGISEVERVRHLRQIDSMEQQILKISETCNG